MLRKFFAMVMAVSFGLFSIGCAGDVSAAQPPQADKPGLPDGRYEIQQASYDDSDGMYSIALLNAAPPVLQTGDLQMARLTEEETASGQGNYLEVTGGEAALHIDEEFRLEYVHGVEETQTDPATGQQQVIVRRESGGFWAPFAGVVAGQAIGNALFGPRYYMPPVYAPGGMYGYGGTGSNYSQAVDSYRQRYNSAPPAVQRSVRKSGQFRNNRSAVRGNAKNTGSGIGNSKLRTTQAPKRSTSSFGTKSRSTRSFSRSAGRRRR